MPDLPHDRWPDSTLPLLHDPYRYIPRRARAMRTQAFRMRLMGSPACALTGRRAARMFYDTDRFTREGAVPRAVGGILFGPKGVIQGTDGAEHLHRKKQGMDLMAHGAPDDLARRFRQELDAALPRWAAAGTVDLFPEMCRILTVVACGWNGVPLPPGDLDDRTRILTDMFNQAGEMSPASRIRAMRARHGGQKWIGGLIDDIRKGRADLPPEAPVVRAAGWTHADGMPLPLDVVAGDFLSFLRPIVANAAWVVFLAHALHVHPTAAESITGDPDRRDAFVREVRRLYPFFPVVAAIAGEGVEWDGAPIAPGTRCVLSLYGTNRDPSVWDSPDDFRPDRHLGREVGPFDMIPQGGGDFLANHRCAGEWVSVAQMRAAADWLTGAVRYRVATPDARLDMTALPALPKGGFRLCDLRPA
ncbi:cytochrome P450 [Jannaschia rubra]|uniref:Fatty-acid peroxygenase n=1 Tax=Jannaschia rubra TaxID=282197 RepID=A0A0M6XP98_9RHOB|nr:cytochrome P450 [Jannaschia rubra]CTQ32502.1 Fatty-acid peroxygenase [Jannaschia rubra]SFF83666.1 fatty-acid peroxygenase [Jannaschia rubra]